MMPLMVNPVTRNLLSLSIGEAVTIERHGHEDREDKKDDEEEGKEDEEEEEKKRHKGGGE